MSEKKQRGLDHSAYARDLSLSGGGAGRNHPAPTNKFLPQKVQLGIIPAGVGLAWFAYIRLGDLSSF